MLPENPEKGLAFPTTNQVRSEDFSPQEIQKKRTEVLTTNNND
jgi:hypothetical protein